MEPAAKRVYLIPLEVYGSQGIEIAGIADRAGEFL